jgi:hypothetical protein
VKLPHYYKPKNYFIMILAICYMKGESSPFEKIKGDFVNFKKNGVKEVIRDGSVFTKLAKFVTVKIKEI